jgi:hypothetical protein
MATGMLESILGYDPIAYQQKRLAAITAPMQSGSSYQRLGAALGTLASRALGGPDPALSRISKIKQIQRDAALASGGDRVRALEIMQDELSADPELAEYSSNVADILDKLKSEQTKRFAATQEMVSKSPEALTGEATRLANVITRKAAASGINAQVDPATGALVTPLTAQEQAVIDAFPESQQLNQLSQVASRGAMRIEKEFAPETVRTESSFARVASELGFGVRPNLGDYTQAETTAINAVLEARGLRKASASAPKLGPSETEEAKAVGKGAGEQFTKVTITDPEASAKKSLAVRELQILAGQVNTGTFTEIKAKAQAFAKEAGFDLGDPTNVQTLRAAIERGVAQTQVEQKGVQTDRDAIRYRTAGVLLTNTPAANQYIVDYQIALDNRVREKASFFEKFREKNNTSVGAERAWQESIKDKDIFDSPTLSKYKDTFKMNDLAKRVRGGQASQTEKAELATLMKQFGLTAIPVPR